MRLFETIFRYKILSHGQGGIAMEVIIWMSDKEISASAQSIEEACSLGTLQELANEYLLSCHARTKEKK